MRRRDHHHDHGELKVPTGGALVDLSGSIPLLLAYVLAFINVGLYWNNHHHLLHITQRIDGRCSGRTCSCSSGSAWYPL
nr:TMEM175 family protein [Sphingomonas xinjiangensis]